MKLKNLSEGIIEPEKKEIADIAKIFYQAAQNREYPVLWARIESFASYAMWQFLRSLDELDRRRKKRSPKACLFDT